MTVSLLTLQKTRTDAVGLGGLPHPGRRTVLRSIGAAAAGSLLTSCLERGVRDAGSPPSDSATAGNDSGVVEPGETPPLSPPVEWTRSYDSVAEGGTPVPTPDVHVASVARADDGYALAGRIRREGEAYDPILLRTDAEGRERWRGSFGGGNADRDGGRDARLPVDGAV